MINSWVGAMGYWVTHRDRYRDFIYDIENDFVEVEGGRVLSQQNHSLKLIT